MLIQVKSRESYRLGRFVLHIDDYKKLVRIQILSGPALSQQERRNVEKYLRVVRPDIVPEHVISGWGIEASIDLSL